MGRGGGPMSKAIEILMKEHRVIEGVLGALDT